MWLHTHQNIEICMTNIWGRNPFSDTYLAKYRHANPNPDSHSTMRIRIVVRMSVHLRKKMSTSNTNFCRSFFGTFHRKASIYSLFLGHLSLHKHRQNFARRIKVSTKKLRIPVNKPSYLPYLYKIILV